MLVDTHKAESYPVSSILVIYCIAMLTSLRWSQSEPSVRLLYFLTLSRLSPQ
jgi:hypothetical protein